MGIAGELENVLSSDELRSLAWRKKQPKVFKSIPKQRDELAAAESDGWRIVRDNKYTYRLARPKKKSVLLEDRVWSLLYRLGFSYLSGDGGAFLKDPGNPDGPKNQIDVVGIDDEVGIAIECKSSQKPRKNPNFQKDLAKHALMQQRFSTAVRRQFSCKHKRACPLTFFLWDLIPSDNDLERAKQENMVLFDEKDLAYYEQLSGHLGPAAKYQFFADLLPGRRIHGLQVSVPALETKMGKHTCYSFSITPEYLLKIAYVSHRAKGKASDVDTYQRMIKKFRLNRIKEYISEEGIFPTNIVVNLEKKKGLLQFHQREQQGGPEGAKYGTLRLSPCYRSAWIIDGQHRLFAYSGHERAQTSYLSVLAFEGLPPDMQAQLFIDINHEQKSVKRSLLVELFAELNWGADDDVRRANAIISKVVQALSEKADSPFHGRILLSDDVRTSTRCISLENLFRALQKGLLILKTGVEYGPLWAGDSETTLKRAVYVLEAWFRMICDGAEEWWDAGSGEDGGLAMNDGVSICTDVLKSVFRHLSSSGYSLIQLTPDELIEKVRPFGDALGQYLGGLSRTDRELFRAGSRGNQGRAVQRRKCEKALSEVFPKFEPPGLKEALQLEKARTNEHAYAIIQRIETTLRNIVLEALKVEYDSPDTGDRWFFEAVPAPIREKSFKRFNEEKGRGNAQEDYFDLLDYRKIVLNNWSLFQDMLGYGTMGNKEKRTDWIDKLNVMRRVVMHPGKARSITWDELAILQQYEQWVTRT